MIYRGGKIRKGAEKGDDQCAPQKNKMKAIPSFYQVVCALNPFKSEGISHYYQLEPSISKFCGVGGTFLYTLGIKLSITLANARANLRLNLPYILKCFIKLFQIIRNSMIQGYFCVVL